MSTIPNPTPDQVKAARVAAAMTPTQFSALAELLRLRPGPAQESARLHLVDGLSVPDAAREAGCGYRLAWQAVKRVNTGLRLAQQATLA